MAAAGGACILAIILLKHHNAGAPAPEVGRSSGSAAAPVEAAAQPVEIPPQSVAAGAAAVVEAQPAPAVPSAPPAAAPALPRTREAFLALADSEEMPAAEKRRLFFATAASADVPAEVRRSGLMLGLRRIEPGLWPDTAGKLLLDEAQPAWIHDALMQDLHARGHEFNLPWFDKVAASPTHVLKRAATDAASTYRRLASQMTEEIRRSDAASVKTPD